MLSTAFAVASIRRCWNMMGTRTCPEAEELFITADAGDEFRGDWNHVLHPR
ncbi:MAG TPA: hypothetical protein ENI68_12075 [Gammaproteobacteria bacterium]|nr:hypothetical protein [Gammaproteobacteria bacterium]